MSSILSEVESRGGLLKSIPPWHPSTAFSFLCPGAFKERTLPHVNIHTGGPGKTALLALQSPTHLLQIKKKYIHRYFNSTRL